MVKEPTDELSVAKLEAMVCIFIYNVLNTYCDMLGNNFSRLHFIKYFFSFFLYFDISCKLFTEETICLKCQTLLRKINEKCHLLKCLTKHAKNKKKKKKNK